MGADDLKRARVGLEHPLLPADVAIHAVDAVPHKDGLIKQFLRFVIVRIEVRNCRKPVCRAEFIHYRTDIGHVLDDRPDPIPHDGHDAVPAQGAEYAVDLPLRDAFRPRQDVPDVRRPLLEHVIVFASERPRDVFLHLAARNEAVHVARRHAVRDVMDDVLQMFRDDRKLQEQRPVYVVFRT